jgi:hypothetical protein
MHSVADTLYRVRAQVAPRLVAGTRFIGLGVVALGGFLVAEGNVVIGSLTLVACVPLTWVTGVWAVPGSIDAYLGKITSIVNDCYTNLQYDSHHRREGLKEIKREAQGLIPPQDRLEMHQAVLADIGQIEVVLSDSTASFADRAVGVVESSRALRQIGADFDGRPTEAYIKALTEVLERYRRLSDSSKGKNQQSLHRLQGRVSKLRPPKSLSKRHSQYLEVINGYISAMNAYCAMNEATEAEIRVAAVNVESAYAKLDAKSREYIGELRLRTGHVRGTATVDTA